MPSPDQRLLNAFAAFDAANSEDPNQELVDGQLQARELVYAQRMTAQLTEFCPNAIPAVQLAARAQHICRWKIPRADYPMDRQGYQRWRMDLARFHAETAAAILQEQGYDSEIADRVTDLLLKRRMEQDSQVQLLEDVVCLVFLRYYLAD